jgi:7 transmembrane receptor (rhodopsin family)
MAAIASVGVWLFSFGLMFPVVLYADHVPQPKADAFSSVRYSCKVHWPAEHALAAARAYVTYTAVIGFALPVGIITSLYAMLVARLRTTRRHIRSGVANTKSLSMPHRRNVTTLVALIITVFVICWLPYWVFQVSSYCTTVCQPPQLLEFGIVIHGSGL